MLCPRTSIKHPKKCSARLGLDPRIPRSMRVPVEENDRRRWARMNLVPRSGVATVEPARGARRDARRARGPLAFGGAPVARR